MRVFARLAASATPAYSFRSPGQSMMGGSGPTRQPGVPVQRPNADAPEPSSSFASSKAGSQPGGRSILGRYAPKAGSQSDTRVLGRTAARRFNASACRSKLAKIEAGAQNMRGCIDGVLSVAKSPAAVTRGPFSGARRPRPSTAPIVAVACDIHNILLFIVYRCVVRRFRRRPLQAGRRPPPG